MKWIDEGIVLSGRKYGETASIVSILTRENGRYLGLVHGAAGKKIRPILQMGNIVRCEWSARLEEHLGKFKLELVKSTAASVFEKRLQLFGTASVCGLAELLLPERDRYTFLYDKTIQLLDGFTCCENYMSQYVRWELDFLSEVGFGLNLQSCIVSGVKENLSWVSPRSGCAVSRQAGAAYSDRLLTLPGFILQGYSPPAFEIIEGLRLTGHFLGKAASTNGTELSPSRDRFVNQFTRQFA